MDTVGAGDLLLASLLYKMFKGDNLEEKINFGCAVGAMVAGSKGVNPKLGLEQIHQFMNL